MVADQLPAAGGVLAGSLDHQPLLGPHHDDAPFPPLPLVAVQQDDATLQQGGIHRFAHHADDAATVGDEALPGEPLVTKVGVALDRLVQIQLAYEDERVSASVNSPLASRTGF